MTRGIMSASDVPSTTIDGEDINTIWAEFQATLDLANEHRSAIAELFTYTTTLESDLVAQMSTEDDFEEASEFGVPTSINQNFEKLRIGFPLSWFDKATRFTWKFLRDATSEQVRTVHSQALEADNRLVFRGVMNALLGGVSRQNEKGTAVYPLWNADSVVPPAFAGNTFAGTHTHYLTTNSANIDGEDIKDLITHITHHGYGTNPGERVIVLANPAQTEDIRGLRVADGSPFDFITSDGAPAYLTTESLVGERPPSTFEGLKVIGSFGDAWVVEDHFVPSGYVIALATAGRNSPSNPLAFREHIRPEYSGLRQIPGSNAQYPLAQAYYSRGFGVGVRHRGAAAVMQVTVSTTYTAPTI